MQIFYQEALKKLPEEFRNLEKIELLNAEKDSDLILSGQFFELKNGKLDEVQAYIQTPAIERMQKIAISFGVNLREKHAWKNLAEKLAKAFIPGLNFIGTYSKGRKTTWCHDALALYWYDVRTKMEFSGLNIGEACVRTANAPYWKKLFAMDHRIKDRRDKTKLAKSISEAVARNKYDEARKCSLIKDDLSKHSLKELRTEMRQSHSVDFYERTKIIHPLFPKKKVFTR